MSYIANNKQTDAIFHIISSIGRSKNYHIFVTFARGGCYVTAGIYLSVCLLVCLSACS